MKNMGKFSCFSSTCCNLYDILEFVAQDEQGKILFDLSFIVVIITELMMESKICYSFKICAFFSQNLLFKFQVLPHFLSVELTMFICGFFKYLITNSFLDSNIRVRTMIWSFPHCTIMGKFLCLDGPTSKKCE